MSITIDISDATRMISSARKIDPLIIMRRMARVMDRQNKLTVSYAEEHHLNFPKHGPTRPDGLRNKTNNLRRSYSHAPAVVVGNDIISDIGSAVRYARPHEYGAGGVAVVHGYYQTRHGYLSYLRRGRKRRVKQKTKEWVKGHARRVNLQARAPIRRSVDARMGHYQRALVQAVADEVERFNK